MPVAYNFYDFDVQTALCVPTYSSHLRLSSGVFARHLSDNHAGAPIIIRGMATICPGRGKCVQRVEQYHDSETPQCMLR